MKNFEKIILALILLAVLVLPLSVFVLSTVFTFSRSEAILPLRLAAVVRPDVVQTSNGALVRVPGVGALQGPSGDQLVLGGTYELESGQTLEGGLVVLGGMVTTQADSVVEGDAVLLGGTLQLDGRIEGDIVAIGGSVDLGDHAVVAGDVNVLSGRLSRADGARVEGRVNRSVGGPLAPVVIPSTQVVTVPGWDGGNVLLQGFWLLLRSILWAIVALLVVLLLPEHSERVRGAVVEKTGVSLGMGLLTTIIAPLLLIVITITIIGIPVSLLGVFLLALAWAFGVIVVGLEVGQRLVKAAKQEWAPAVAAGLGVFLVTLVGNAIGVVVPCIGWMIPAAVGMLGLGAVLITRFGTQHYQPYAIRPVEPDTSISETEDAASAPEPEPEPAAEETGAIEESTEE